MKLRKTTYEDLPVVMELYAKARVFMAAHGNPYQWGTTRPEKEVILHDILTGSGYVCEDEGKIVAVFCYKEEADPTYARIEDGKWLDEEPYGVIHRIVSDGTVKGAASFCICEAFKKCGNIRIDTHKDNHVMQNLLKKLGFIYCGIIYVEDGSERMAYQKKF